MVVMLAWISLAASVSSSPSVSFYYIWVVANVLTANVDPLTECLLKLDAAASLKPFWCGEVLL